jgi:hypothetical protein
MKTPALKVNLEDGTVHPNPAIRTLMDTSHQLFGLAMETSTENGEISLLYATADDLVKKAIEKLYEVKNTIARLQGEI